MQARKLQKADRSIMHVEKTAQQGLALLCTFLNGCSSSHGRRAQLMVGPQRRSRRQRSRFLLNVRLADDKLDKQQRRAMLFKIICIPVRCLERSCISTSSPECLRNEILRPSTAHQDQDIAPRSSSPTTASALLHDPQRHAKINRPESARTNLMQKLQQCLQIPSWRRVSL